MINNTKQKLFIAGNVRIQGGTPGAGKVLTSIDESGMASWEPNQNIAEVLLQGNDAGLQLIKNIGDPLDGQDAATKAYVDQLKSRISNLEDMLIDAGLYKLKDFDGNKYDVVGIGEQVWMAENLKTTSYRDGSPIEYPGSDNTAWENNTTGAYAWYDNDISWKDSYGPLYNWYAVNNSSGLCPAGWHVPTDNEITQLTDYLGGIPVAGGKMKSTVTEPDPHPRWNLPNTEATNESAWTGFPGGYRSSNGTFFELGQTCNFWSSTEDISDPFRAWGRNLNYNSADVGLVNITKSFGFTIRCIKD